MIAQLGAIIPVHGPIGPVLDLLTDLLGDHVPAADRPARTIVVDDASP